MPFNRVIGELLAAKDEASLKTAVRSLCAQVGEVSWLEVLRSGAPGDFCAFCLVKMKTLEAEEALLRRFGFGRIGDRIFLPITLPAAFGERKPS